MLYVFFSFAYGHVTTRHQSTRVLLLQGVNVLLHRGRIQSIPMSGSNNVNAIAFARLTSSRLKRPILRGIARRHTADLTPGGMPQSISLWSNPKGNCGGGQGDAELEISQRIVSSQTTWRLSLS